MMESFGRPRFLNHDHLENPDKGKQYLKDNYKTEDQEFAVFLNVSRLHGQDTFLDWIESNVECDWAVELFDDNHICSSFSDPDLFYANVSFSDLPTAVLFRLTF